MYVCIYIPGFFPFPFASLGVNWERHSKAEMCSIAKGLGGLVLSGMLETIARDGWVQWAGGLPDLLLWTHTSGSCVCSYVLCVKLYTFGKPICVSLILKREIYVSI